MSRLFAFDAICAAVLFVFVTACGGTNTGNDTGSDVSGDDVAQDVVHADSGLDVSDDVADVRDSGGSVDTTDSVDDQYAPDGLVDVIAPDVDVQDDLAAPDAADVVADADVLQDVGQPLYSGPCIITKRFDPECDGEPLTCEVTEYNQDGTKKLTRNDPGCDGLPPFEGCTQFQWDSSGRLVSSGQSDSCGDVPDSACTTYTYDEFDRVATENLDEECSGSPGECYTYTYDPSGNLRTVKTDFGCTGENTVCLRRTFDGKGNVLTSGNDELCDEVTADEGDCRTYDYLGSGRISGVEWDPSCSGDPSMCHSYEYFSVVGRGTVVVEEQNDCAGGSRLCRNSVYKGGYQYLTESEVDPGCDGTPASDCKTFTYDGNGNVAMEMVDSNCDDSLDYCIYRRWSGDGVLVLESRIPGCTQPAVDCSTFSYQGACASAVISDVAPDLEIGCGQGVSGNTAMADEARFSKYNCIGWTPTAKEQILKYVAPVTGCEYKWKVTATLTSLSADLDLLLLSEPDPGTCVHKSTAAGTTDESISWQAIPGSDYFLVVEGYGIATGTYNLNVVCECLAEPLPTCKDSCGGRSQDGTCGCDKACKWLGDCCVDWCEECADVCAEADCGEIDSEGVCEDNTAKYCLNGVLVNEPCGGQTCEIVGFGMQLPIGPCSFLPPGLCDETQIVYMSYRADCVD